MSKRNIQSSDLPSSVANNIPQIEFSGTYSNGQIYIGTTDPGNIGNGAIWINPNGVSPVERELRYQVTCLQDKPLGLWMLNEIIGLPQDASGNGNHTSIVNGTPTYNGVAEGVTLSAASNQYFSVPDSTTLEQTGSIFTIEAWVKPNWSSTSKQILSKGANSGTLYMASGGGTSYNLAGINKDYSGSMLYGSQIIPDDTNWHHLVATANGAAANLYLDGASIGSTTTSSRMTSSTTSPLLIGADTGPSTYFDGSIKWVAYYSTVLSSSRVAAHYAIGAGA
jgi:hypothetical protein